MTTDRMGAPLRLGSIESLAVPTSNFTLFILPFRYELRPTDARQLDAVVFEEENLDRQADDVVPRVRYLTGETRGIMFGQQDNGSLFSRVQQEVRSYRLTACCALRWHAKERDQLIEMPVTLRVVLFDRPSAEGTGLRRHESCGCVGFLIVRVTMVDGMRFADLLDVNANFRLLHYQWAGQAEQLKEHRTVGSVPEGWARFPVFDLWIPGGASIPASDEHWNVSFWRELLHYPVREGKQRFRIQADIDTYPDDRAYITSHACVDGLDWQVDADGLPVMDSHLGVAWHQFLYVEDSEAPPRGGLARFEYEWVKQRTYRRWGIDLRLFGFSNYSFCSLCTPSTGFPPAVVHFEQMYLDQLLLLLYQRTAVFGFGRELTALTQRWKREKWGAVRKQFRELRAAFGQFVNLYWFPAFTNQVQGLEMYELARRELGNQELFDELRTEMEGAWGFMESQTAHALNLGAAVFASVGLIVTYLGMSLFQPDASLPGALQLLWPSVDAFALLLVVLFATFAVITYIGVGERRHWRWCVVLAGLSLLLFLAAEMVRGIDLVPGFIRGVIAQHWSHSGGQGQR
jgi:hypothetical protein